MGRCQDSKNYLNSGLAVLTDLQITRTHLAPFHSTSRKWLSSLPSLEHTPFGRKSGARGKKTFSKRKAQTNMGGAQLCFCSVPFFLSQDPCVSRA